MLTLLQRVEISAALLTGMQDGISVLDTEGAQVFVNDAFLEMLGFEREELLGAKAPFPYWPSEELAAIQSAFERTKQGELHSFELIFLTKDDRRIPVIVSPSIVRGEDGTLLGYIASVQDIRGRKQLEQALVESEQRWRSIAENPFDFVVVIDRDYRYRFVNHTAPGIAHESLIGKATPFDYTAPEYHEVMRDAFETTFATGRATSYEMYSPQVGAWYSSIVGPIREHGRVTAISILTREITQQKLAEEALRRSEQKLRDAQKMEAIGTLAGGIAHDLNNLLTPIIAYSDPALLSASPNHPLQAQLRSIHAAATRAADLVRQILLFSRRGQPDRHALDLVEQVRDLVELLRAAIPPEIELTVELPAVPVGVLADRTQLDQLLVNLVTNALQAMDGRAGGLHIAVRSPSAPGDHAALIMSDTGPGMNAETQRRAFEPFFTTKSPGSGTGLGLSIVHGIVRDHGGDVSIVSALGQGTTFTVTLPRVAFESARQDPPSASGAPPKGAALRILCVDDQPAVVEVVCEILTQQGHSVHGTTTPQAAIERFTADPTAFDVLVTDQTMPGLTGKELLLALRTIRPNLACVLMTGLGDGPTTEETHALCIGPVLAKPFTPAALLAAVEHAAKNAPTSRGQAPR